MDEDVLVLEDVRKRYDGGEKCFAVCFEKEGHFLQKYRAKFIADCIHSMLTARSDKPQSAGSVIRSIL